LGDNLYHFRLIRNCIIIIFVGAGSPRYLISTDELYKPAPAYIAVAMTVKASLNIVVGGRVYKCFGWVDLYSGEPAPTSVLTRAVAII
jgi:hypothetical protein